MKNFPHQFNDLKKLKKALLVVEQMIGTGADVGDDGEFGVQLAKAGVYTFRDKKLSIAKALRKEQKKSRANRGTEAAARDIQQFFELAGLIAPTPDASHYKIAALGNLLLLASDQQKEHAVWRSAMHDLALTDSNGNTSHPYQILLRLVNDVPGLETAKLMLALAATDDSEETYKKLKKLATQNVAKIAKKIGATPASARNAVKILPAIARQLGDIAESANKTHPSHQVAHATEDGISEETVIPTKVVLKTAKDLPKISAAEIAKQPVTSNSDSVIVDLADAIKVRKERTKNHQSAVQSIANVLEKDGYALCENPWDCLAIKNGVKPILVEVKTLDGSASDERNQAQRALAQLKSYLFFDAPEDIANSNPSLVAAFAGTPSKSITEFLKANGIISIWLSNGKWIFYSDGALSDFTPAGVPA